MMLESEANELSEEVMLGAVLFAHDACKDVVKAIVKLAEQAAKDPWDMAEQADLTAAKRSEEHTSELQSLMRISYAVFCLKKKNHKHNKIYRTHNHTPPSPPPPNHHT